MHPQLGLRCGAALQGAFFYHGIHGADLDTEALCIHHPTKPLSTPPGNQPQFLEVREILEFRRLATN